MGFSSGGGNERASDINTALRVRSPAAPLVGQVVTDPLASRKLAAINWHHGSFTVALGSWPPADRWAPCYDSKLNRNANKVSGNLQCVNRIYEDLINIFSNHSYIKYDLNIEPCAALVGLWEGMGTQARTDANGWRCFAEHLAYRRCDHGVGRCRSWGSQPPRAGPDPYD